MAEEPHVATVIQAYRVGVALRRCPLRLHWGLDLVQQRLDQRRLDPTVEVPWTLPALRREWNRVKHEIAPWWTENSKEAYSSGLDGLARALKNFSRLQVWPPQGPSGWLPDEKEEGSLPGRLPVYHRTASSPRPTASMSTLPRIGALKTHESTRKLARRLEQGTARILAATITRTADRWFVSFTVEVQRHVPAPNGHNRVVGVDVGVHHLATLSTGSTIPNPRALERSLRKLRRLNRQLAGAKPGSNHRKATRRKLARVHARAANLRRDALNKLTTTLATQHGTIVVEQLNLAGLVRNRRLARSLADASLAELRRQLAYRRPGTQPPRTGRPVLSLLQDVLGLRLGESQAHPGRAHLHLRGMRAADRP